MIEKIIAFLEWIQSSEKLKNRVDLTFSMLFIFVSAIGVYKTLKEILFQRNYGYYYDSSGSSESWIIRSDYTENTLIFSLILFLLFSLICVYIYGVYKRVINKDFSVVGLVVNSALPIFAGIIIVALYASEQSLVKWYIILFGSLYAFSAYMLFISGFLKENHGRWSVLFTLYKKYTLSFLIGFSIFIILFCLGNFREFRYMDFSEIVLAISVILIPYAIITWLILTYAWTTLDTIDEVSYRKMLKFGIALAFLFTIIWISPNWKEVFIDNRIDKAQSLLQKHGENRVGYEKAGSIWWLDWAMKERYLENRLYNKELYAKLFDQSIEEAIDEEIDVNKYRSRSSNGTSMLARGENAKVELNFAKHESMILSDIGAVETTVTYEFQNTDTQNQEVIYSIELPNAESAMTDLRLGLNLELTGVLAPRGAAEKVYEESLRRNTDPALLEQTGPTTYRLRVFPVLSKSDPKTQGRQRVQYKYVTPLHSADMVTTVPKTDILNLKLTEKSEIMTRVSEGTKVLLQDSEKSDDIEILNAGKKAQLDTSVSKDIVSFCSVNTYPDIDLSEFRNREKNLSKNIVFLDISKSAGEDKKIKARYQELIDAWKNNGVALDIYTFNTAVTSAGYDISGIDFWGTTDMARVITYIMENGVEGANIVILTDDSSYELALPENKNIDYKKIKSNRISLITIGEKIRTLKTEVTKSILATEGNVTTLSQDGSLEEGIKNLFTLKKTPEKCESYSGSSLPLLQAVQGYSDGKKVLGEEISKTKSEDISMFKNISPYSGSELHPLLLEMLSGTNLENTKPIVVIKGELDDDASYDWAVWEGAGKPSKVFGQIDFDEYQDMKASTSSDNVVYITLMYTSFWIYASVDEVDVAEKRRTGERYIKGVFYKTYPIASEVASHNLMQEAIAKTARVVNQSMSLIALETEGQRESLESYSQQGDRYDTQYKNFSNESSNINQRGISANSVFGSTTAVGLSVGSSSYSGSGALGGSSGGFMQYILVILGFPLIAWFVLKRKPKIKQEKESTPEKPEVL